DWLKTNLARISSMMQGQRDLREVSRMIMSEVTPVVNAQHGAFFLADAALGADGTGAVDIADGMTGAGMVSLGDGNGNGGLSGNGHGNAADRAAVLRMIASYGYKQRKSVSNVFAEGEGLVGQAALERKSILITEAPGDYIKVTSGLGESAPVNIAVMPVLFEDDVLGVIELASLKPFADSSQAFLDQLMETIGVTLNTIIANARTERLLQQSQSLTHELQSQSEELQTQQDELKRSNVELEEQAQTLKASEELLQSQQEELQQTNEELQEKAALLAEQNRDIEIKNQEIEFARSGLEEKAEQLALSSKYKSEFLANMSHELRTPLNSLLILSKLLADNEQGNLTPKQTEFASTIHGAGSDLLSLINNILDLSKVEAGKMEVHAGPLALTEITHSIQRSFTPLAEDKGLRFEVERSDDLPETIVSDDQRLQQILRNLLSNAFKFTESGGVSLRLRRVDPQGEARLRIPEGSGEWIAFSVSDTGVGIPQEKLMLIFEAFQQADGTTSRRFGGTGLGLSISREIARLLGGEIHVESTPGEGSTFTLYLPVEFQGTEPSGDEDDSVAEGPVAPVSVDEARSPDAERDRSAEGLLLPNDVDDDRRRIDPGDRVILFIDADADIAKSGLEAARAAGNKALVALQGDVGLTLAKEYAADAIVLALDLAAPGGMPILADLKRQSATRHIPVYVIAEEGQRHEALLVGATEAFPPPVTIDGWTLILDTFKEFAARTTKRLLVVEDNDTERNSIVELIGGGDDIETTAVGSSAEALQALADERFDCMVLDLKLPDMTGFALLEKLRGDDRLSSLPVIVYTGQDLSRKEETQLKKYAETIIVKDARSPERLVDETSLYLHRDEARLPAKQRDLLEGLHHSDAAFDGRKILVVDDDVRNVFALTSVLESHGMDVVFAENGRDAIESLADNPDVDLVLMDVMMPEMDGYETTRAIRAMPQFGDLPIISLTAKAMQGDREKSIAAGASDYITKPVNTDQLLSLMRVWLHR
ncbi:MAG: response regulator, partial [Actinomycetota bacterium]|nr:response regulator [Actinomycetota bacterium]